MGGLEAVDDGRQIFMDQGETGGGLHARRGIDAPVPQGAETVILILQNAPSHDGKSRVNAEYDHKPSLSIVIHIILYHKFSHKSKVF